ncbi:MAG TPA: sugar kinase [Cyclobacteriaceae bacterium]|jgi:2-dehydro-3-deoxygluconokinase|nr:sugar kinase [Cyclobacteriaceae bacterium]
MKTTSSKKNKIVTLGEVMMRLSPPGYQRFSQASAFDINYGGSEANVSVSLAHWGFQVEHVTCFPANAFGEAAEAQLRSSGVGTSHIQFQEGRLGLYFIEHGADYRSSKVIYDRFDSAFAKLDPAVYDWTEILKEATWFHWSGITPAISEAAATACADAIKTAKKLGLKISGDINYRRNLWGYGKKAIDIMPSLISECDLIIGGTTDFENCAGIHGDDFADGCKKLQKRFPNVTIIGNPKRESVHASSQKISGKLWAKNALLKSKGFELTNIVDRVGSGDAFAAGLIYGFLHSKSDQESLEFAVAACALKHTIPGDVNRVSAEEIHELVRGENIGKLLR